MGRTLSRLRRTPPHKWGGPVPKYGRTSIKKARALRLGLSGCRCLGYADALGARALRARLDFERNLLATLEAVEVTFGATAVEKVFLSVLGLDESKATIRNQLFDSACGHYHLLSLERRGLLI